MWWSKLCIDSGFSTFWEVIGNATRDSVALQQYGSGMVPSKVALQLFPTSPISSDQCLYKRKTGSTDHLHQWFLFFFSNLKILTNKKTKLSLLSKVSAVLAGLNLKCSTWGHVILWFYCMSKAFQPTLVCLWSSYMSHLFILQLLKGMSDVFFWSSCKKVTGPYFTLPLERRRLTHAKCSFQSFVLVISTQAKESVSDKLVDCLLFLTLVKEIVKCTRNMFWKLYYFLFFLKHK